MKKYLVLFIALIMLPLTVNAEEGKKEVKLSNCVDSTSARFILNDEEIKIKLIGIETGEFIVSDDLDETNGKPIDEYVCSLLKNAKKIEIEYEPKLAEKDKFGRTYAWVFIDDVLLEEHLVTAGAAKVAYLYDDYKYNDVLLEREKEAKEKKIGIWKEKIVPDKQQDDLDINVIEVEDEGFFGAIGNFFRGIFNSIVDMFNNMVEDILE